MKSGSTEARRAEGEDEPSPAAPKERARSFALAVAPGALLSPGGVPPALTIRLGGEWDPIPEIGVEALALIPVTAGTASAPDGSVDLRMLAFGGGARGLVTDPASRFGLSFDAGATALFLSFAGKAAPPQMAETGARWAVAPYLGAALAYRVHPALALRVDVLAAVVLPEPALRVDGKTIATFGLPAVLPSFGIEVRP
jgi:hypothetical protein